MKKVAETVPVKTDSYFPIRPAPMVASSLKPDTLLKQKL
jgi:hypothetical protein